MPLFYEVEGVAIKEVKTTDEAAITLTLPAGQLFTIRVPLASVEGAEMLTSWSIRFYDDDPDGVIIARRRVRRITVDSVRFCVDFFNVELPLPVSLSDVDAIVGFAGFFIESLWIELVEV